MSEVGLDIEEKLSALVDDSDFSSIDARMARFNVFEAMGAVRSELRHSNFLAFLLSPGRSHGLGSEPLLRLLRAVLARVEPEQRPLRPLELVVGDLDNAIVYRERDNMDLLIELKAVRLVVLIENKIGARAGEGQLARYKSVLKNRYADQRHLLVFLTPDGTAPDEEEYIPFDYSELADVLDQIIERQGDLAPPEIQLALRHYVEMLRRHIVPDEALRDIARQLYERHKEAFEFIYECRPTPESLLNVARELLSTTPGLVEDRNGSSILRFLPLSWVSVAGLNAAPTTMWTKTGRNALFEIKTFSTEAYNYSDRVALGLVIGPADQSVREKLYIGAKDRPKVFRGLVKPMGKQWATIYSRDLLSGTEARNMETDQKIEAVRTAWQRFITSELPDLDAAMLEIAQVPGQQALS
jgi:hypothetical protein